MNNLQHIDSEDDCLLKLTNEPAMKTLSSEWDTHKISWLPSFGTSRYVYADEFTHTRLEVGKPVTSTRNIGFSNVMQLLWYLKSTYSPESPIYQKAKKFFSEGE